MENIVDYCAEFTMRTEPWTLLANIESDIKTRITQLGSEYRIRDDIAVHKTAIVDPSAIIKSPAIIGPGCFVGPNSLLRGGVYLLGGVSVGPSCELKRCIVGSDTAFGHFNFIGDSIVGARVNFEAGALTANYYNERADKTIFVRIKGEAVKIKATKFGALIGDDTKVGANAVTSPGTILAKNSVVKRLELIEQVPAVL